MGVVTVFALEDCPFCKRAKSLLRQRDIPFTEISLSDYPEKRVDMTALAKALTVPQIFFNDEHVGGATELLQLDADGKLAELWAKTKAEPDTSAPGLLKPDYAPKPLPEVSARAEEAFTGAGGASLSAVELARELREHLPREFSGRELVRWLGKRLGLDEGSEELDGVAQSVAQRGFLLRSDGGEAQAVSESGRFRVYGTKYHKVALNVTRKWVDRVNEPVLVVRTLKKRLGKILNKHRDDEGLVDYQAAAADDDFAAFDEATCELQAIEPSDLEPNTRKAYLINTYNLLTLHAFVKAGIATSDLARLEYFDRVGYELGGGFFSFNAIENGLLRGNKVPPYHMHRTLPSGDARLAATLPLDPRIHAALNCGAKSCPPIKSFSAEAVQQELDVAAAAFFEQDDNCTVHAKSNTVVLTQIVKWYSSDFGSSKLDIVRCVRQWLEGDKAAAVDKALASGALRVKFHPYDWTTDAKRHARYSRNSPCSVL